MVDGGCNNSAGNGVVELEFMRRDSFSWHPCQISLCSSGLGLIVQYGNNNFEETIADEQEICERIRVRSIPLQGDDCSSIKQGELVLVTKSLHSQGVFYDARVEEVIHVRHSKRIHCRCSFRIKWLHQANEDEALTVSSSSIMKLSTQSIHLHPTISTFFSMMESPNGVDSMPCPMIVDGINSEIDISVLLEKQIKEIGNSTDISQEIASRDFILRQEVDLKGQSHAPILDASLKDPHSVFPFLNNLKGSNGRENKKCMETAVEIPLICIPSIEEEFTESKFLSPLAARAALASLRSEFPQSPRLSEQDTIKVLNGRKCCSFTAVDHSSNTEDFPLKKSATLKGKSPNFERIVKKLFPTSDAAEVSNLSSNAKIDEMDEKKQKKITQPSHSRFTRAQAQKINGKNEATQMTKANETELRVTRSRRVTRSTVEGVEKIEVKEYNAAVDDNVHAECTKLDTFSQNSVAAQNCLSDKQKLVASPIAGETSECFNKDENNLLRNDRVVVKEDLLNETFIPDAGKQNNSKRPTHSAARGVTQKDNVQPDVQMGNFQNSEKHSYPKRSTRSVSLEETEKNNVQRKLRKSSFPESNEVDLFKEDVIVDTNRSEPENSLNSPLATKVSKQSTPKCSESGVGSYQGTRQKSSSSKKQETRFSPRLKFLPRTRSQSKA